MMSCVRRVVGLHRAVVPDRGVGKLQHVPGDRDDVAGDVPGAGAPQDVPGAVVRVHAASRPLHRAQHPGHPRRHLRDGALLLLLGARGQEEGRGRRPPGVTGTHAGRSRQENRTALEFFLGFSAMRL